MSAHSLTSAVGIGSRSVDVEVIHDHVELYHKSVSVTPQLINPILSPSTPISFLVPGSEMTILA